MICFYSGWILLEYEDCVCYIFSKYVKMGLILYDQMIVFILMMIYMVDVVLCWLLFLWICCKCVDVVICVMMFEMDIQFLNYMEECENVVLYIKFNVGLDFNNSIGEIVEGFVLIVE